MANYCAFTRSTHHGKVADEEAVRALLDEYVIDPTVEIENGELVVYGYCGFNVWAKHEDREGADYSDDRVHEFLFKLAELIEGDLWIKTVGHEKLRYVSAYMWHIKDGNVFHATLEQNEAEVTEKVLV